MTELLNVDTIAEPFDLQTALRYMDENSEFIRFKNDVEDYYIYKETQKRPAVVGGKRKLVEVPLVWAFDRYNNSITTFKFTNMFDKNFYIMKFDEAGEPIWDDPTKKKE